MKINGSTISPALLVPAIVFVFWLGGLSITVANDTADQNAIEKKVEQTALDVAAIKQDIEHNKETLDRLEKSIEKNQDAILKAIRDEAI